MQVISQSIVKNPYFLYCFYIWCSKILIFLYGVLDLEEPSSFHISAHFRSHIEARILTRIEAHIRSHNILAAMHLIGSLIYDFIWFSCDPIRFYIIWIITIIILELSLLSSFWRWGLVFNSPVFLNVSVFPDYSRSTGLWTFDRITIVFPDYDFCFWIIKVWQSY